MTKKLIAMVVLLFAATITLEAQEIKWMTFDQAIAAQKKKPKKIFIVVNYKGQRFENKGYDPALADRRNSIHPFTNYLQVQAYPTMLFLDENADLITSIASYMTPSQLEVYLKLFATNDYKKITTQQEFQNYQNNFKSTFKAN